MRMVSESGPEGGEGGVGGDHSWQWEREVQRSEETGSEKKGVIDEGDNSSDVDGKARVKVRGMG